ncbi:MAG: type II toxin-antitoxin system HicA family toxin [Burkholderiales bacterium]|nr:type II toxin-antitoxin system HicA family toxin [Burkholderiales bacterium]
MGTGFTPELIRLLTASGCRFERHGKGDHDIWYSPITNLRFPVDSKIKSRHTANAVLKQAGLKVGDTCPFAAESPTKPPPARRPARLR